MASSFFEGFAQSFSKSVDQRRLKDQLRLEDERERRREAIQQERFQQQQELQRDQFQALEQFREKQNQFRQQQILLETRKADLDFASGLTKIFDPKTSKNGRKLLLGTMAGHLGIDRNSQQYKDVSDYINNMDEIEQKNIGAALSALIPNAKPGQIMDISKVILGEGLKITDAVAILQQAGKQQTRDDIIKNMNSSGGGIDIFEGKPAELGEGGSPDPLEARRAEIEQAKKRRDAFQAAGLMDDMRAEQQKIADLSKAGEFEPEMRGAIKEAEITAERKAELAQPVTPKVLRALGLDPKLKWTKKQAMDEGIDVDLDDKTLMDINRQKAAVRTSIKQVKALKGMVNAANIGAVGGFAQRINSIMEQGLAFYEVGMGESAFTAKLRKKIPSALAKETAVIESRMIDLSFNMAKAVDDGRLSNQDVERFATALGKSQSESQFKEVLDDMAERLRDKVATDIEAVTGNRPIDLMTTGELKEGIAASPNADVVRSIKLEMDRRIKEFE